MSREYSPDVDIFGDCSRPGCDEPCPWDMSAIIFDLKTVCCSPDCALTVLEGMGSEPKNIALHDPQYYVDRSELDIDPAAINIWRGVTDAQDTEQAIKHLASLFPHRFREMRE